MDEVSGFGCSVTVQAKESHRAHIPSFPSMLAQFLRSLIQAKEDHNYLYATSLESTATLATRQASFGTAWS